MSIKNWVLGLAFLAASSTAYPQAPSSISVEFTQKQCDYILDMTLRWRLGNDKVISKEWSPTEALLIDSRSAKDMCIHNLGKVQMILRNGIYRIGDPNDTANIRDSIGNQYIQPENKEVAQKWLSSLEIPQGPWITIVPRPVIQSTSSRYISKPVPPISSSEVYDSIKPSLPKYSPNGTREPLSSTNSPCVTRDSSGNISKIQWAIIIWGNIVACNK